MIFELLILILTVLTIALLIVQKIWRKDTGSIVSIIAPAIPIFMLISALVGTYSTYQLQQLVPTEEYALQEIHEGKYAIHSADDKYHFMYNDNISTQEFVQIVSVSQSKYSTPTVILCRQKPTFWRPLVTSLLRTCYILVVDEENILELEQPKQQETLPEWLTSHSGEFLLILIYKY